jgi:hypothetical protein
LRPGQQAYRLVVVVWVKDLTQPLVDRRDYDVLAQIHRLRVIGQRR